MAGSNAAPIDASGFQNVTTWQDVQHAVNTQRMTPSQALQVLADMKVRNGGTLPSATDQASGGALHPVAFDPSQWEPAQPAPAAQGAPAPQQPQSFNASQWVPDQGTVAAVATGVLPSLARGAADIPIMAGQIAQAPLSTLKSWVEGAEALSDRFAPAFLQNKEQAAQDMHDAQQAADAAAAARAANAKSNPIAAAGQGLEQLGTQARDYWQEALQDVSPGTIAQQAAIARAHGVLGTLAASVENPAGTLSNVEQVAPTMAVGAGAGGLAARLGARVAMGAAARAATAAAQATIDAGGDAATAEAAGQAAGQSVVQHAAETAAEHVGNVVGSSAAGMGDRQEAKESVQQMPLDELQQTSQRFRDLVKAGNTPAQARDMLSDEIADQVPLLSAIAVGTASHVFGTAGALAKTLVRSNMSAAELATRVAQTAAEEGAQTPGEGYVQYKAEQQVNPNAKFDLGAQIAQGIVAGAATGAGMHGAGFATDALAARAGVKAPAAAAPAPSPAPAPAAAAAAAPAAQPAPAAPAAPAAAAAPAQTPADTSLQPTDAADLQALGIESEEAADQAQAAPAQAQAPATGPAPIGGQNAPTEAVQSVSDLPTDKTGAKVSAESPAPQPEGVPMLKGAPTTFSTDTGGKLGGQYALVDAAHLVTSHDTNLRVNPDFPPALQPRDRERAASEMQISSIVNRFEPARLAVSADAGTGSPIIGPDGVVESGNGRTIAIKRVYQANGQKAADYRDYLRQNAPAYGFSPDQVDTMRDPVLVRLRTSDVDRAEFARQANASTVAQMAPSEQARADAARIDTLDDLHADDQGDFANAASQDFIRRFVSKLPPTEQAGMVDANGRLSTAGYARVRNAVLAKAYGNSSVLQRMTESLDDNVRNVTRALLRVAPSVAKAREGISAGVLHNADLAPNLVSAVDEYAKIKEQGVPVETALAQHGLFGEQLHPATKALLQFLSDNIRRPNRIAGLVQSYYDHLQARGNPAEGSLFGDEPAPQVDDLLSAARSEVTQGDTHERQQPGLDFTGQQPAAEGPARGDEAARPADGAHPRDARGHGGGAESDGVASGRPAPTGLTQGAPEGAQRSPAAADPERFPDVATITNYRVGPGGFMKPRPIEPGARLHRETSTEGLDDLLRHDAQPSFRQMFVSNDPDLALGQGANRGVHVTFRPDSLSGREHAKPMSGAMDAKEYQTDLVAPRAVESIKLPTAEVGKLRGLTKRRLGADFLRRDEADGTTMFTRKEFATSEQGAQAQAAQEPADASQVEGQEVAPNAEKKAEAAAPEKRIEDVGENLRANRRNFSRAGVTWEDIKDDNSALKVKESTKAKAWPRPDYEAMVQGGADPLAARLVKQVYDGLAAAPAKTDDASLQIYLETMGRVRAAVQSVVEDAPLIQQLVKDSMSRASVVPPDVRDAIAARVWPQEFKQDTPALARFARGTQARAEALSVGGNKALKAMLIGRDDLRKMRQDIDENGWPAKREAWHVQGWRVIDPGAYTVSESNGKVIVTPKGLVRGWSVAQRPAEGASILLDQNGMRATAFDSHDAAVEAARAKVAKARRSQDISGTNLQSSARSGPARRQSGEHVDAQKLMDDFGFRGVNFGREGWIKQGERQEYLDAAYDALHDLAEVLGVPPKALSLDGMLGIAFGAQGRGGHAAAHFVPGYNEINLTRTKGAGTLAHEWGHALDHYFANVAGLASEKEPFLTAHAAKSDVRTRTEREGAGWKTVESPRFAEALRPEILQAFRSVVQTMDKRANTPEEAERARKLGVTAARRRAERALSTIRQTIDGSSAANKPDLQREFDQHAQEIQQGNLGDGYEKAGNLELPQRIAQVRRLVKEATGRFLPADATNELNHAAQGMRSVLAADESRAGRAAQMVSTDYARESAAKDSGKSKPYWGTPWEKFARAFELYVHDRLAQGGHANTFLSDADSRAQATEQAPDTSSSFARGAGAMRDVHTFPYPRGVDRQAIAEAMQHMVQSIETRPTDRGVAMFARTQPADHPALRALAQNDSLFALPRSSADTVEGIARDIDPTIKVSGPNRYPNGEYDYKLKMPDGAEARMTVRRSGPTSVYGATQDAEDNYEFSRGRPGENPEDVPEGKEDVWIDVSKLKPGGGGTQVYAIAANFAHNTGRIFIGDPSGLSDMAMRRRPEQMLSSALKFGTTEHLAPHPRQVEGAPKLGIPPLRWVYGDHVGNIRRLIDLNLRSLDNQYPSSKNLAFDPDTGTFTDERSAAARQAVPGSRLAGSAAVQSVEQSQSGLAQSGVGARREGSHASQSLTGRRTAARGAVLRALVREEGGRGEGADGGRADLLARIVRLAADHPQAVRGIFYSRDAGAADGQRVEDVAAQAAEQSRSWNNAPPIVAVRDLQDPKVPERVRAYDAQQRSLGASGEPEGFYYGGNVYLVASQLRSAADVARVLAHETLGHAGLRGLYGKALDPILDQVVLARRAEVLAKAKSYGLGSSPAELRQAAEEVLATMAQERPTLGFVRRAVAAIRTWLRANVPAFKSMRLSDDEIVRNWLAPAAGFIRRESAAEQSYAAAPAMTRAADDDTDELLREYGEPVENIPEALARHANGDRVFGFHEQGEDPTELTSPDEIDNFAPDQLLVLPRGAAFSRADATDGAAQAQAPTGNPAERAQQIIEPRVQTEGVSAPALSRAVTADGVAQAADKPRGKPASNPRDAAERAQAIIDTPAATPAPLDSTMHALTRLTGIEKVTNFLYHKGGDLISAITPERVKAGIVSDYGVPDAVLDARSEMVGNQRRLLRKAGNLVSSLQTLTRAESRVAYAWMNEKDSAHAASLMKDLPEQSVKVLQDVRAMIDDLSKRAVKLGMLDQETFERHRFAYLRRSYLKHVAVQTPGDAARRARAISVLGDQYKGRGIVLKVGMDKMRAAEPDWWKRKLEQGKADTSLKGEKFIRLERRAPSGEGTAPLDGMEDRPQGKLQEVHYWPAGEAMPAKYKDWSPAGTFEVRDTQGGNLLLWRDFTKEERERMGEIDDARFAIARTLKDMAHDVEVATYLDWLARNHGKNATDDGIGQIVPASEGVLRAFKPDEWVLVPDTKIPGTQVLKYGNLAGKAIPGPIWNDVRQTVGGNFKPFGEVYSKIMRAWKANKTALSPTVHLNNVMSNFVMADWHDVSAGHLLKALRIVSAASSGEGKGILGSAGNVLGKTGISDREAAREILNRFQDSGASMGNLLDNEDLAHALDPLLAAAEGDLQSQGDGAIAAQAGVYHALQLALHRQFPQAWDALRLSKPIRMASTEAQSLMHLYEAEDNMFRLAVWLRAKEGGATDGDAGRLAKRSMHDYQINAPWINAARTTFIPFISYTYRAVPLLLRVAATKPHKLLKLMVVAGALNALFSMLASGGDKNRKMLPEEKAGKVWGLVPKLMRMPWNDRNGSPVYLDIRRFLPMGDVFDLGEGHAAIPLLPSLYPSGPLATVGEIVFNKSLFTGEPIVQDTDTPKEKMEEISDYLYKSFMPNVLGVPDTWATQGVVNAATGKTDPFGRQQSVAQAVASSLGVKLGSYPADVLRQQAMQRMKSQIGEINTNIYRLAKQRKLHGITEQEFQRQRAEQIQKIRDLTTEYREKFQ